MALAQPPHAPTPQPTIDRPALYLVLMIAFLAIFGGLFQFRHYLLTSERELENNYTAVLANAQPSGLQNSNEAAALQIDQTRDDDQDSINNFQETSIYGTSPYLADTDSDGINDPDEIAAGSDPNCPTNGNCASTTPATGDIGNQAVENIAPNLANNSNISRDAMMTALQKSGVNESTLANVSDSQLRQMYQELQATTNAGANPIAKIQDQAQAILQMSISEKRELLKESGIAADTVDNFTDDEVNALIEKAVSDILKEQGLDSDSTANTNSNGTDSSTNSNQE